MVRWPGRSRTFNGAINSRVLCQLSYGPMCFDLRTPPRIRTGNLRNLNPTPLPVGPEGHGADGGDRARGLRVGNETRYRLRHIHVDPRLSASCSLTCPAQIHSSANGPRVGRATPGLTVPRPARAADGHRQPGSHRRGLNPRPPPYQGGALPLSYGGDAPMGAGEPRAGFEPAADTAYKAVALAGLSYRGVLSRLAAGADTRDALIIGGRYPAVVPR